MQPIIQSGGYTDAEAVAAVNTDNKYVKKDGTEILTADWDIGDTRKIIADEIRARDGAGLKLHDDGGNGLIVEDTGTVNLTSATPMLEFTDTSDSRSGQMIWETNSYGDRWIFHVGDAGARPSLYIQRQSLIGTDDLIFIGYNEIINSNFIFEQYKGKNFVIQTRNPESGAGNITFRTGVNGAPNTTYERIRIEASNGGLGIGDIVPTALLDVNSDTVRLRTAKTPASATATGNQGDICWDANYVYVCTATDTWQRAALSSW